MKLIGKRVIVTGASRGLGMEIAKEFVKEGADVLICSRNSEKLKFVVEMFSKEFLMSTQKLIYCVADIGNKSSIDKMYDYTISEFGGIDIVVNNAGIYGPIGPSEEVEWKDLEEVVNINLLGTVYSMRKAILQMKKQGDGGKIINLSGGGATKGMPNFLGYSITKTGVVRATEAIANEVFDDGIYINAVAPGALNTHMLNEALSAGEASTGKEMYEKLIKQKKEGGASLENAAKLITYLASDEADGISGRLISAVWDDWEHLAKRKREIKKSDIYTLRRIIPKERGYQWE